MLICQNYCNFGSGRSGEYALQIFRLEYILPVEENFMVVLGQFPENLEEAIRQKANAMTLSARSWQFFSNNGDIWTAFRGFLDASRHASDDFQLATHPATISSGSVAAQELSYLISHGFRLDPAGTRILLNK
jgi:hypothetical protein